jgi:hypothetical protein
MELQEQQRVENLNDELKKLYFSLQEKFSSA